MGCSCGSCRGPNGKYSSKAEQVGDLNEKLPAVIDEVVPRRQQAGRSRQQAPVEVLQIGIVPDVDRRSRVHEVGDEEVGVEVLRRRQGADEGVGKHRRVLEDDALRVPA